MRQRRKKQNACLRLLCCLCNSIIEAEKGERSPQPPSPPRPIIRRPSRPPQEPIQPTMPPFDDIYRKMTDFSSFGPPVVDDNWPFFYSGDRPPSPLSPPRPIFRRPSRPPQEPTQPTMPPLDDMDKNMTGLPSIGPPVVDDNRLFFLSGDGPPPPLSPLRPIFRRPSRPPQEPTQSTRPPLDDIDRRMTAFPSFGPPVVDGNRPFISSGDRPPRPLSPPRPIIRRPSRPTIVGPRPPLDDDGRKMTGFSPSGPPFVDDNEPFVSSMSVPSIQNPEEHTRPVQPSGNGPWAGSNERHEVSIPGSGSGLSIPFDRPPDV